MDEFGLGDIFEELGISNDYKHGQQTNIGFIGYLQLVDWKEPWLVSLLICHLLLFVIIIKCRNMVTVQSILGVCMLGVVYMSETINELAAENWRLFSAHQYFDSKGFFISAILSAPLLVNCLLIVVNFLLQNYNMLKDIKRMKVANASSKRKDNSSKKSSKKDEVSPDMKKDEVSPDMKKDEVSPDMKSSSADEKKDS